MGFPDPVKILSILNFAVPFLWLAAILAYQIKFKSVNIKWVKRGILAVVALFIVSGAYYTITTYNLWKADPISKFLLPPYQPEYFYRYAFFHFWLHNIVNILASLAWAGILLALYKCSNGRFLDKTDIWQGFFAALAAGWPNFVIYLAIFFGSFFAKQFINVIIFKNNASISITPYLIFSGIITMIAGNYFISRFGLEVFRI